LGQVQRTLQVDILATQRALVTPLARPHPQAGPDRFFEQREALAERWKWQT